MTALAPAPPRHPAKFSAGLIPVFQDALRTAAYVDSERVKHVLDPFAGIGSIHVLRPEFETVGIELEAEWAAMSPHTICGDARRVPFDNGFFDAVVTSPAYGNRMADHHNARDDSRRNTYRHALGRDLTPGNGGAMQWGVEYRAFHLNVWQHVIAKLRDGGWFVLNIKDHIRGGNRMRVSGWHVQVLQGLGMTVHDIVSVVTPGQKQGANSEARVAAELVVLLRKPNPTGE